MNEWRQAPPLAQATRLRTAQLLGSPSTGRGAGRLRPTTHVREARWPWLMAAGPRSHLHPQWPGQPVWPQSRPAGKGGPAPVAACQSRRGRSEDQRNPDAASRTASFRGRSPGPPHRAGPPPSPLAEAPAPPQDWASFPGPWARAPSDLPGHARRARPRPSVSSARCRARPSEAETVMLMAEAQLKPGIRHRGTVCQGNINAE